MGSVILSVNGEPRGCSDGTTVADLLRELKMQPKYVAVERNFELIPRQMHEECLLRDGDSLEIVTLVGGG